MAASALRWSSQAVLDILCHILFENLSTQQCTSHASRTASDENTAGQRPSHCPAGPTPTLSRAGQASAIGGSNPEGLREKQDVAHQLLGWWQFTNRAADLLMRSHSA
ncbi:MULTISPECIES: hypothetical protein [unclassified Streptomyces]|uniref:hypothetical protein n=1 Tax=unclassified Streptomyces TaxID=2593676 RepID=UPI002E800A6C|nr:hypothetical protein [Streptomyces sp. NBC_00589]WTI33718.1 hypothetical protein OIC96_01255 [Streptomyces sp. NBC_00775]WUB32610.1 hypothetical protein OHA51_48480 [Streptomyces sp. NBC_00589]